MRAALLCLLVFSLSFFLSPTCAFEDSYLPLDKRILSHRVPQKLIAESMQIGESITVGKTKMTLSNGLTVRGSDTNFKPWIFNTQLCTESVSIWSADLDKNGTQDLIFYAPTGGCGWSPGSHFIALLFEKNGRPFPWSIDGYFEVDSHGIKDLLDINNDGRAELIRQSRDEGYWITSLYEARNARWSRMHDAAGIKLPLFTRFTYTANKQAVIPPASRQPFEPDFSNDANSFWSPGKQHFIEDINWADVTSSEDPDILLSGGKHCSPAAWCSTMAVVLDEPGSRRMALLMNGAATYKLLKEIAARHLPVSLSGIRKKSDSRLSSELIFAQSKSTGEINPYREKEISLDLALKSRETELP